ncbi:PfkB family carbohydrate kinase, partial [Candidatus Pelagibacter ubique]|nr:PfkB family carbohydrate kinase [Candidatus Pelagibacter ubique]
NLKNKLKFKNIVLKKGKKGSCMIDENNDYFQVKSNFSKVVYDVAGAGDHFLAMFASLNKSISPQKKLLYSNKWAGYNLK